MMHNSNANVDFWPLDVADLYLLTDWLSRPHVLEWWGSADAVPTLEDVHAKYLPRMNADSFVRSYIAQLNGDPVGFIQSYVAMDCEDGWWEDETDPGVRGIDLFLADCASLDRGLGTRMVNAFTRALLADDSVTRVQADPHPRNARAIRCFSKSGFVPIQEIVTPDGPALLMVATRGRNPRPSDAA